MTTIPPDDLDQKNPPADGLKSAWKNSSLPEKTDLESEEDIDLEMMMYMEDMDMDLDEGYVPPPPPPSPKASRKFKNPFSFKPKGFVVPAVLALFAGLFFIGFFQIPGMAKSKLEAKLHAAGFPQAQVNDVSLSASSVTANNVKLDEYGFDEIKTIQANINWPSFLTSGDIGGLNVNGLKIGRDSANIGTGVRQFIGNLLLLPAYRISVSDAVIDITTDFGELRVNMDATVTTDQENGIRTIKARVQSSQYQLAFDSSWNGTLSKEGTLDLSAEVVDGRLNIGPLRISRFNGWIGTSVEGGSHIMQSQMEAGSASFMDVPLQNLSLIGSYGDNQTSIIFRSGISGMPDVLFTGDMLNKAEDHSFSAILSGNNLGMFLDYIEEATGRTKEIRQELIEAGDFRFTMNFEPEKRFVGGPLPFSLSLRTNGTENVKGNILYYPDTLDVRGSLETEIGMANALQDYFKIPAASMRQNFIRLDGDIRRFFYFGENPTQ